MPEVASRHHLELANAVVDDALARAGATLDDVDLVAVTAGPGPGRRAAGRRRDRQGRSPPRAACRWRRSTTSRATSPRTSCARGRRTPLEPPFLCLIASGGHTFLARVERPRRASPSSARRSTTPPARPSTRARACSACRSPAARTWSGWRAEGDPAGLRLPDRQERRGPGLLLRRPEDRAALQGARPGRGRGRTRAAPTSPPPTSTRSSSSSPSACERALRADRPGPAGDRRRRGRQRPAARAPQPRWRRRVTIPPRELCTDNAAMIASAARYADAVAVPGLPRPRRLRHRAASACSAARIVRSTAAPAATCATTPASSSARCATSCAFALVEHRHRGRRRPPAPLPRAHPGRRCSTVRSSTTSSSTRPVLRQRLGRVGGA